MSYSFLNPEPQTSFKVGVVRPFECLSEGWQLVKPQIGLFFLLSLIILVLVTCIPFAGIIWGAWVAGIYVALFARMRGETVSFNSIGKGFEHFGAAFLVAFLSNLAFIVVGIGMKIYEDWEKQITRTYGEDIPGEVLLQQLGFFGALALIYVVSFIVSGVIFPFAYQLVVDKGMSGWEATKLSARAARANFGGVFGLLLLEVVLGAAGLMLCCVGLALVLPIMKGAWAVAYARVFSMPTAPPAPPLIPPPPPSFGNYSAT